MQAMMSERGNRSAFFIPWAKGADTTVRAAAAMAEAQRILAETEPEGVHHDILPGLLRYDLQPMRDLAESLSAFLSAPDPAAYLAEMAR